MKHLHSWKRPDISRDYTKGVETKLGYCNNVILRVTFVVKEIPTFVCMQVEHTDIARFILELSEIPATDPLVHLDVSKRDAIVVENVLKWDIAADADWNRILKTASQNKREADLDSLCLAYGTLSWSYKEKTIVSPLLLCPVSWKIRKATGRIELTADHEAVFLNPFVKNRLLRDFGLNSAEIEEKNWNQWLEELSNSFAQNDLFATIEPLTVIGNFHHHRYRILRELELLEQADTKSALVETILGNESAPATQQLRLIPELLFPADASQLEVFRRVGEENLVIQGPPGTGKSQVLTNLLGKCIAREGLALVVSEKKTALEVLEAKLRQTGLDAFAFLIHSQTRPHDLIRQLKTTWNQLEAHEQKVPASLLLSDQLKDQLQLALDKINLPDLVGGLSYTQYHELLEAASVESTVFRSDVPTVKEWLAVLPDLKELYQLPGITSWFAHYKQPLFAGSQPDQIMRKLGQEIAFFAANFGTETLNDLERLYASVARCQLVENESFKSYFGLHAQPRELKRFRKLRTQYVETGTRLEWLSAELTIWKQTPSRSQVESWQQQFSGKSSWLEKRRIRRAFKQYLIDPSVDPMIALSRWLEFLDTKEQRAALETQFAAWGMENPEVELASAAYILDKLEQEDANELNRVSALSSAERKAIVAAGSRLKQLLEDLDRYCTLRPGIALQDVFSVSDPNGDLQPYRTLIGQLPPAVYRLLGMGKPLDELHAIVLHSNWKLVESRFPELAAFDGAWLQERLEAICATEGQEFELTAAFLKHARQTRFAAYATILRTPATRLNAEQKALKQRLKTGKSILVKEFGKSRQHQTIRELVSGDARLWIELLVPVWLSTPAQVGNTFPMERALFDLVIFDEASQIPLPHALGALQRAQRAVIAGDEQQMAPSNYFSGGKAHVDLLHQAGYYWTKVALNHHYRSVHPALIAFSNRHFYNNELVAYPSPKTAYPLHRHFVEGAIYDERTNPKEAVAVAAFLETVSWKQHIGITTFSEQQLECLWKACSPAVQEKISEGQEQGTVFFKALEQVQGDECDILVISMGYGKNTDGEFHLRFGPLNQANGHKRLNVLLTRARKELHFFTSVHSTELGLSSNESVNLLRLFLHQLEQPANEHELLLPYQLQPVFKAPAGLHFRHIWSTIPSAQELATFYRIMKTRGWKTVL